ncbi:MAG: hypothetical protein K1X72_00185 [Pyrinomonadaceae bacterium]|nr:hypothetical protein [Pyrinomonadaceae bacterium]
MNQKIFTIETNFNLSQKIAWSVLILSLILLLAYGLSIFFSDPKNETITTNPGNISTDSNSYINKTQDADYKTRQTKKHLR